LTFKSVSDEIKRAGNTAPKFLSPLEKTNPIPCVDSNKALSWSYIFPKAVQKEIGPIS